MLNELLSEMLRPEFLPRLQVIASLGVEATPHLDPALPPLGYRGQGDARQYGGGVMGKEVFYF